MRGAKQKEMFEISDLRRRVRSVCPLIPLWGGVGGGGGGSTLAIFWGFKILIFNFFFGGGGAQMILWIFLGGHHKIGLYLEVISILGTFLKVKVQIGGYFWGC